ncbi:MAG TPA: hypothetical protein VM638_08510 [Actinomycetota bacterium]|nr:hypothetical protein [Actinomycetota bacterium]
MSRAELVFANVLDGRHYDAEGVGGQPLVYVMSLPARATPFAVVRHWKAPQGIATEHFELVAPSGRVAYASEPRARRFPGQMDLTELIDVVDDAVFGEIGIYVASFLIDGDVEGQVDFQVFLAAAPQKLPKDVEDALKKSDVIWVGAEGNGSHPVPTWFVYRQGRIYVLHGSRDRGEQEIPGLPEAEEVTVVTRRKGRETRADRFPASVRLIPPQSPEFDQVGAFLADRRRDRHIPPGQAIAAWRQAGLLIAELTPAIPA